MIVEKRQVLTWISFPEAQALRPGLRTVYLQAAKKQPLWTHIRQAFTSYELDLSLSTEQRWQQYSVGLRSDLRRSKQLSLEVRRHQDPTQLIALLTLTNSSKGLSVVDSGHFRTTDHFLITEMLDIEVGVLAAHAYLLDGPYKRVKLAYNASAFRKFPRGSRQRSRCGLANILLFDQDFDYFRQAGYSLLDFGGYGADAGTRHFKDKFGGRRVQQYNYFPIWYYGYRK
ncbi:MAG: hypothetical protein D6772_00010, partial [Bacteroidetes bacterium]